MTEELPRGEVAGRDPAVELSVVIPAYNEEQRLGASLERVLAHLRLAHPASEVLVVDDGSTDGTVAVARAAPGAGPPVRVVSLRPNQGKGAAVRAGVMAARGAYILMTDADLSAPIEEVGLLLEPVRSGQCEVAIGSRGLPTSRLGRRQPWTRERMGRIFNVLVRAMTGLAIYDTQCGFKLFEREAARHVFALQQGRGFAFDAEVLYIATANGYRIREEPVTWNNAPGSKVNPIVDSVRMAIDLLRIRVRGMHGAYVTSTRSEG